MKRSLISSILLPLALMTLLVIGINVAQASPAEQQGTTTPDDGQVSLLAQPWQVRIQQRLPLSISLNAGTAVTDTAFVDTSGASITDTSAITSAAQVSAVQPLSIVQPLALVLELDIDFVVTRTLTTTVPASITLRLADGISLTLPVSITLAPITQTTVVLTPQAAVTSTVPVTETAGITTSPEITSTPEITATTDVTEPEATEDTPAETELADSEPLTDTVETGETDIEPSTPDSPITDIPAVTATATVTANLRSGPETTAAIVGRTGIGQEIGLVATNDDGTWFLLTTGAWIFGELVDGAPADLPQATPELIDAVVAAAEAAAAVADDEEPAPEPTPAVAEEDEPAPATPTGESDTTPAAPADVAPTVNVDANLRSGPATEFPVIGGTITGQQVNIIGRNSTGEWYLLDNGGWVAVFLVDNAPADVPVVPDDATPETVGATPAQPAGGGSPILVPTPTPGGGAQSGGAQSGGSALGQAERVYLGEVTSVLTRYDVNAETISDQIAALGGNAALLQDQAWRDELQSAANTLALSSQQVRGLEPPALFAGAHVDLRSAAGSYDLVADLVGDGLTENNAATFQQVLAELDFAGTLVQLAREKLSAAAQ